MNRATFIQEQLRLLVVQTEFDLVETVAYRHQTTSSTWGDLLTLNDTMSADDPFIGMAHYMQSGSMSNNHWVPATEIDAIQHQADDLLAQVAAAVDPVKRKAISDELQLLAMEQYWRFPYTGSRKRQPSGPKSGDTSISLNLAGLTSALSTCGFTRPTRNDRGFKGQTTGVPGGL